MTARQFFIFSLFTIHFSLFTNYCHAQDYKYIDSLKNEIIKFDAHNKELGNKFKPLMDSIKANVLYDLLLCYYGTISDTATWYAEQCKTLSEQIGYKKGIGNYYNGIGLINMVSGRNFALAEESFKKALKIRMELGDKVAIAWTYNNIGLMYGGEGNYLESIKNHSTAIQLRKEFDDLSGVSESYKKRGSSYLIMGNYTEALKDYLISLKYAEESKNKGSIESSYLYIGQLYEKEGNYTEALKYYIESSKVKEQNGDSVGIANSYVTLAAIYLQKGDTVEALKKNIDATNIYERFKSDYEYITSASALGMINFYKKNYDEALKYFFAVLKKSEGLKDKFGISNSNMNLAMVYERQGKYQVALKYVNGALSLALEIGNKDAIKDSYKILSEIYEKLNDFREAYKFQLLYQQMKDTLMNVENTSKMKQLQMQYDFDKDAAIQKAQQDKKDTLLAKEVETQKYRRNTSIFGMGVLVIFLVVVIIQRNRIAKERRKKELERERNRISRDLHDDLGSGLISILMMSEQIQNPDNKELIGANIEKIKQSSKLMVEQMRIIIWAMNSMNDTLENLLIYIQNYALDYFEDLPIELNILFMANIPPLVMTGAVRRAIFLVVKESLNNITQHAHATEVYLSVAITAETMSIVITDNGVGFEVGETRRFGNGLKNMKSRMSELNGTFNVESKMGEGTKISINVPLA